jgi:hypothetical protein
MTDEAGSQHPSFTAVEELSAAWRAAERAHDATAPGTAANERSAADVELARACYLDVCGRNAAAHDVAG